MVTNTISVPSTGLASDITIAATLAESAATMFGQPALATGVADAAGVASTVAGDIASGKSAITDAKDATVAALANAPALIAKLPKSAQSDVATGLATAHGVLIWLESLFADL
jgi:hypothetical protein